MKFKIGEVVKVKADDISAKLSAKLMLTDQFLKGKVLYVNAKNRYLVQFQKKIGSHCLYGIGSEGYCQMIDEDQIKKGGNFMSKPSLLKQLLDADLKLIAKEVMDIDGNLVWDDPRVQEALLKTDGFKTQLVKILKDSKKKCKHEEEEEEEQDEE